MYCHILRVRAIPTLESTDSMICGPDPSRSTFQSSNPIGQNNYYTL